MVGISTLPTPDIEGTRHGRVLKLSRGTVPAGNLLLRTGAQSMCPTGTGSGLRADFIDFEFVSQPVTDFERRFPTPSKRIFEFAARITESRTRPPGSPRGALPA